MPEELKDDLKTGEDQAGTDQPVENKGVNDNGEKTPKNEELTQEELQKQLEEANARIEKLSSDNENYKQAIISKNAKNFSLTDDEPEDNPHPQPINHPKEEEEDDSKKAWQEVEKRANEISSKQLANYTKQQEKDNQRIAIKKFFTDHPEIATNEAVKSGIKESYVNRNGKSVDGIMLDLADAYGFYAYKNNINLNPENRPNPANNIQQPPTSAGNGGRIQDKSNAVEALSKYFPDIADKPELIDKYKEAIESGQVEVPKDVYDLLFND